MNRLGCIPTMEYYTATRKSKLRASATRVALKNRLLWESSRMQKSTLCTPRSREAGEQADLICGGKSPKSRDPGRLGPDCEGARGKFLG